jgi:hypothetical protein
MFLDHAQAKHQVGKVWRRKLGLFMVARKHRERYKKEI